jgi:GNAT superfamily N-acetyltransferase
MSDIVVKPVAGRTDLERFLRLPWTIYAHDPNWVPPLLADVRAALDTHKHPFYEHADIATFLAWRGSDVVGRIAAVVNHAHNRFHEDTVGFFGLFESIDNQAVARALLHEAESWLHARGMTSVQGPHNLSTNEEVCSPGVLIDGFHRPPSIMMTHTPAYYAKLLETSGYTKAKDLIAYWLDGEHVPERLQRAYDRMLRDGRIRLRSVNLKNFDAEVAVIQDIYNSAWERNWGFVPMSSREILHLAKQLRPVVNPHLCVIAELDDEPVGFALGLPDFNIALKHVNGRLFPAGIFKLMWHKRKIETCRAITLGLKPHARKRAIDALMIAQLFKEGKKTGIWKGECSWILEDNWEMRHGLERVGGTVDKTYRVFEKPLTV